MTGIPRSILLCSALLGLAAPILLAQDIGQGAIVTRDTRSNGPAPVYAHEQGDAVEYHLAQNDYVAGFTYLGFLSHRYEFQSANGRIRVIYFQTSPPGPTHTAWMDPADLRTFNYDCGCGATAFPGIKNESCSPFRMVHLMKVRWNDCFLQSARTAVEEGQAAPQAAPASAPIETGAPAPAEDAPISADQLNGLIGDAPPPPAPAPPQATPTHAGAKSKNTLTDDDVVEMVKAHISDKAIIDSIQKDPGSKLDASPKALIHLKKEGVSSAVIDAVVKRAS